jgi:hypothetical protein
VHDLYNVPIAEVDRGVRIAIAKYFPVVLDYNQPWIEA